MLFLAIIYLNIALNPLLAFRHVDDAAYVYGDPGLWVPPQSCTIYHPPNGYITLANGSPVSEDVPSGSIVHVHCRSGFKLTSLNGLRPTTRNKCLKDGNWQYRFDQHCVADSENGDEVQAVKRSHHKIELVLTNSGLCSLPQLKNGVFKYLKNGRWIRPISNQFGRDFQVQAFCLNEAGDELPSGKVALCQGNQQWSISLDNACEKLEEDVVLRPKLREAPPRTAGLVTCDIPKVKNGVIKVSHHGRWVEPSTNRVNFGIVVLLECSGGREFAEAKCGDDGWDEDLTREGICRRPIHKCSGSVAVSNGFVSNDQGTAEASRVLHCNPGYVLEGPSEVRCSDQGLWQVSGQCVEACGPVPAVMNGKISASGVAATRVGETRSLQCDDGFRLSGSTMVICQKGGQWQVSGQCIQSLAEPNGIQIQPRSSQQHRASAANLQKAVLDNDLDQVKRQLTLGVDVNVKFDSYGNDALFAAVYNGYDDIVKFLLSQGANVKSRNQAQDTPLILACDAEEKEPVETVALLLSNLAEVNATNAHGETALHRAAFRGYDKLADLLLEKGADANVRCPPTHELWPNLTPLLVAERHSKAHVIEKLLKNSQTDTTGCHHELCMLRNKKLQQNSDQLQKLIN